MSEHLHSPHGHRPAEPSEANAIHRFPTPGVSSCGSEHHGSCGSEEHATTLPLHAFTQPQQPSHQPQTESAPAFRVVTGDDQPTLNEFSATISNLLRAAHRLRGILASHFSEFGLTEVRYDAMRTIRDSGEAGCSQSELAEELEQSESSISTLIERMRSSRLIYRLQSQSDRRKRVLLLTDEGRELLDRVEQCHGQRMATLLACFDDGQRQTFTTLVNAFAHELLKAAPAVSLHSEIEDRHAKRAA